MKQLFAFTLLLSLCTSFTLPSPLPKEVVVTIDYTESTLMINSVKIGKANQVAEVVALLGDYDRIKVEEGFSNYFFDEYGIMLIENKTKSQLHGFMVQFTKQDTEFSTSRAFSGKLYVNAKKVNPFKGMSFMERLIKDLSPRDTEGYKLTGATEELKVDFLYKPGGSMQLLFVNFL